MQAVSYIVSLANSNIAAIGDTYRCKRIVGPMGMGKTRVLFGIREACTLLDFANDKCCICPVYVDSPTKTDPRLPLTYIAAGLHARGLLVDGEEAPGWAVRREMVDARMHSFVEWCERKRVIPVLLLDEVANFRRLSEELKGRAFRQLD